jgi:hypothetical protein
MEPDDDEGGGGGGGGGLGDWEAISLAVDAAAASGSGDAGGGVSYAALTKANLAKLTGEGEEGPVGGAKVTRQFKCPRHGSFWKRVNAFKPVARCFGLPRWGCAS